MRTSSPVGILWGMVQAEQPVQLTLQKQTNRCFITVAVMKKTNVIYLHVLYTKENYSLAKSCAELRAAGYH
jgi:hypothetical protein